MNIESVSERHDRRKFTKNLGILALAVALGIPLSSTAHAQSYEPKPLIFFPGVGGSPDDIWKYQTQKALDLYGIELIVPKFPAYSDDYWPNLPVYLDNVHNVIYKNGGFGQVDVAGYSLSGGGIEMYLALGNSPTTGLGEKKIRNFISISARNLYNLNRRVVPNYLQDFYLDLNNPREVEKNIAGKVIVAGCFGDANVPRDNAYGLALAHRVDPILRSGGHGSIVDNPQELLTVIRS